MGIFVNVFFTPYSTFTPSSVIHLHVASTPSFLSVCSSARMRFQAKTNCSTHSPKGSLNCPAGHGRSMGLIMDMVRMGAGVVLFDVNDGMFVSLEGKCAGSWLTGTDWTGEFCTDWTGESRTAEATGSWMLRWGCDNPGCTAATSKRTNRNATLAGTLMVISIAWTSHFCRPPPWIDS